MKALKTLLLVSAVASATAGCHSRPSPETVVHQMLRAYALLRSYEDRCETTVVEAPGRKPRTVVEERFTYQAPNRFFIGIREEQNFVAVASSDGKHLQAVTRDRPMLLYTDAPPAMPGAGSLLSRLSVPLMRGPLAFLAGEDPVQGKKAEFGDDESLDKQPMFVIAIEGDDPFRLWIGQKDHLLHRVERSVKATVNGAPATQAVTDTRKSIVLNHTVPAERMSFTLPAKFPSQYLPNLRDRAAPSVRLSSLDGKSMTLSSLRGKVVLLDFWAYWCGPCRMELPSIQKLSEDFRPRGVVVYGVTERQPNDPGWKQTRSAIESLGLTFPTLADTDGSVTRAFGAIGLPHTVVIDRQGIVRADLEGVHPEDELRDALSKAGA